MKQKESKSVPKLRLEVRHESKYFRSRKDHKSKLFDELKADLKILTPLRKK